MWEYIKKKKAEPHTSHVKTTKAAKPYIRSVSGEETYHFELLCVWQKVGYLEPSFPHHLNLKIK